MSCGGSDDREPPRSDWRTTVSLIESDEVLLQQMRLQMRRGKEARGLLTTLPYAFNHPELREEVLLNYIVCEFLESMQLFNTLAVFAKEAAFDASNHVEYDPLIGVEWFLKSFFMGTNYQGLLPILLRFYRSAGKRVVEQRGRQAELQRTIEGVQIIAEVQGIGCGTTSNTNNRKGCSKVDSGRRVSRRSIIADVASRPICAEPSCSRRVTIPPSVAVVEPIITAPRPPSNVKSIVEQFFRQPSKVAMGSNKTGSRQPLPEAVITNEERGECPNSSRRDHIIITTRTSSGKKQGNERSCPIQEQPSNVETSNNRSRHNDNNNNNRSKPANNNAASNCKSVCPIDVVDNEHKSPPSGPIDLTRKRHSVPHQHSISCPRKTTSLVKDTTRQPVNYEAEADDQLMPFFGPQEKPHDWQDDEEEEEEEENLLPFGPIERPEDWQDPEDLVEFGPLDLPEHQKKMMDELERDLREMWAWQANPHLWPRPALFEDEEEAELLVQFGPEERPIGFLDDEDLELIKRSDLNRSRRRRSSRHLSNNQSLQEAKRAANRGAAALNRANVSAHEQQAGAELKEDFLEYIQNWKRPTPRILVEPPAEEGENEEGERECPSNNKRSPSRIPKLSLPTDPNKYLSPKSIWRYEKYPQVQQILHDCPRGVDDMRQQFAAIKAAERIVRAEEPHFSRRVSPQRVLQDKEAEVCRKIDEMLRLTMEAQWRKEPVRRGSCSSKIPRY